MADKVYNAKCAVCGDVYNEESNYSDIWELRKEAANNGWTVIEHPDIDHCTFFCSKDKCQKKKDNDFIEIFPYEAKKIGNNGDELFMSNVEHAFTNKSGEDIYKADVMFRRGRRSIYTDKCVWVKSKKIGFVLSDDEYVNGVLHLEKDSVKKE